MSLLQLVRRAREQRGSYDPETEAERQRLEASLIDFVEAAWSSIDVSEYQPSWAIDGLCEHLQAVTEGKISRLLANLSPRSGKTLCASVCWVAWTWARRERSYLSGPGVRFLCASYAHTLSLLNSNLTRRLILSPWYQSLWGSRFQLRADQNSKFQFDNDAGGSRLATSVGGSLLGLGGDVCVADDLHDVSGVESEADRATVLNFWSELSTTRLNDPKQAAIAVVMQRLHQEDVAGKILADEDFVQFIVPMHYDWTRHCVTKIGWHDPRGLDEDGEPLVKVVPGVGRVARDAQAEIILEEERQGALMWPERFGPEEVERIKAGLGPYLSSGRLEQMPVPKGGEIILQSWWQLWDQTVRGNIFPSMSYRVASLDGAFTEDRENDPSALTVWGIFKHPEIGQNRIMLMHAWRKFVRLHGDPMPRRDDEIAKPGDTEKVVRLRETQYVRRAGTSWGLVEWVRHSCQRLGVHLLLIEDKGPGITVAQELRRLYLNENLPVQLVTPRGDKVSRTHACAPMFAQGLVYSPNLDWAQMVIDEFAAFPKGRFDDLVDSSTQALLHLRNIGLARTEAEQKMDELGVVMHRPGRISIARHYDV